MMGAGSWLTRSIGSFWNCVCRRAMRTSSSSTRLRRSTLSSRALVQARSL